MCRNYDELAFDIVTHVGGEQNVKSLKHCVTRLRFVLKDESKAETDYLKNRDGVVTVVSSGASIKSSSEIRLLTSMMQFFALRTLPGFGEEEKLTEKTGLQE